MILGELRGYPIRIWTKTIVFTPQKTIALTHTTLKEGVHTLGTITSTS